LDGKGGEGVAFVVELEHAVKVDVAEDVDVVEEEGLRVASGEWRVASIFQEKPGGFFQAAAGVEQKILFAGNFDVHAEIVAGFQVVDDRVREVMDVDDDFVDTKRAKARERDFEQRAAIDFDQGFGTPVGERAQARAEAGGEDHCLHTRASGEWRAASDEKRKGLTQRALGRRENETQTRKERRVREKKRREIPLSAGRPVRRSEPARKKPARFARNDCWRERQG